MGLLDFSVEDFKGKNDPLRDALLAAAGYVSDEVEEQEFLALSLRDFIEEAWKVVEPSTPFVRGWHIDAICEHLEAVTSGEIERLLINMPPRHMKSLLVSVFWHPWVWTFDPASRWLTGSYDIRLSQRDVQKARRIIQSPWYQKHWGKKFRFAADQNTKGKIENTKTGFRQACSTDSAATGEGGKYILCDDPLKAQDAHSPAKLRAANDWWNETMASRANPGEKSRYVVNMQRLSESDLSGVILSDKGDYVHLCLPAEYEPKVFAMLPEGAPNPINFKDPRSNVGDLLWPELFTQEKLKSLRTALGPQGYASQYQQIPAPSEGLIFRGDAFRRYNTLPQISWDGQVTLGDIKFRHLYLSLDAAFKDTDESDYVVAQVWGKHGPNYFLLDQIRARLSFTATKDMFANLCDRYPRARTKLVEDKANGTAIIDSLARDISGLIPIKPKESKEARAWAVQPLVEAGNIIIPSESVFPWVKDWLHEITVFPRGANDDQVDAFTQVVNYCEENVSPLARMKAFTG